MKLPRLFAACEECWDNDCENPCHYPGGIAWSFMHQKWLCAECWEEHDTAERTVPLVYAKDVLPTGEEQMQRLVVAVAKAKIGVK